MTFEDIVDHDALRQLDESLVGPAAVRHAVAPFAFEFISELNYDPLLRKKPVDRVLRELEIIFEDEG